VAESAHVSAQTVVTEGVWRDPPPHELRPLGTHRLIVNLE
jgi:hypothetical protein